MHSTPASSVWLNDSLCGGQVRLMGSFDAWSRGVALSSAGDAGDSVFHRFEGVLAARKVQSNLISTVATRA